MSKWNIPSTATAVARCPRDEFPPGDATQSTDSVMRFDCPQRRGLSGALRIERSRQPFTEPGWIDRSAPPGRGRENRLNPPLPEKRLTVSRSRINVPRDRPKWCPAMTRNRERTMWLVFQWNELRSARFDCRDDHDRSPIRVGQNVPNMITRGPGKVRSTGAAADVILFFSPPVRCHARAWAYCPKHHPMAKTRTAHGSSHPP